jgi:lipopolysaccharide transport system permease protein
MPIVIDAKQPWYRVNWGEIWTYRELLLTLISRDIKVRYKQTLLGVIWVILQPLLTAGIFTVIFANLLGTALVGGIPYGAFVLAGFTYWQFFSSSVVTASGSVVEQIGLVKKIYLPRVYFPLAVVGRCGFDFVITWLCLVAVLAFSGTSFYGLGLAWSWLVLVPLLFLALGLAFFLAALNVRYRDVKHMIPFVMQVWLYVSPVFYGGNILPAGLQWPEVANPLAVLLNLIREGLFEGRYDWASWGVMVAVGTVILGAGLLFFKNTEKVFDDIA